MKQANAARKVKLVAPYLNPGSRVLDFGCGDMAFGRELHNANPSLRVTGVDVVDFGKRYIGVIFKVYDGHRLPFQDKAFDTVISWHVLHHTLTPFALLSECARVARETMIIVEPTPRGWWEIPGMRFMDWLFNVWKDHSISMSYAFASRTTWKSEIARLGWECEQIIDVELLPRWLPTGRSLLFVCKKKHSSR